MAANDITVSSALSSASIKVTKLSRRSRDTVPTPAAPVTVAAGGNTVINLAPGDTLVVERIDSPHTLMSDAECSTSEGHR